MEFPLPSSPTAEACAELASLTVRVFTPAVVSSIQEIFVRNERLDLKEHLPLLGTLVVRHVALMMQEDDFKSGVLDDLEDEDPQSPILIKHEQRIKNERKVDVDRMTSTPTINRLPARHGKRKSSYRDIAYYAVREKRIVPETLPIGKEESPSASTAETRPVRRLSIRSFRLPKDTALRKTRSIAVIDPEPSPQNGIDKKKTVDEQVLRRRHSPGFWKEEHTKENFSHANVKPSIQSPTAVSTDGHGSHLRYPSLFSRDTRNRVHATPGITPKNKSGKSPTRNAPISRLVQLRKQRLEKKGKQTR